MPTTNRKHRPVKRVTRRSLKRFVQIVGYDGAHAMFEAIDKGADVAGAMKVLRPYFDRYVAAYGEEKDTRKNFYKRLEGGACQ